MPWFDVYLKLEKLADKIMEKYSKLGWLFMLKETKALIVDQAAFLFKNQTWDNSWSHFILFGGNFAFLLLILGMTTSIFFCLENHQWASLLLLTGGGGPIGPNKKQATRNKQLYCNHCIEPSFNILMNGMKTNFLILLRFCEDQWNLPE